MTHDLILFLAGIIVGVMNALAGGGMLVGFPMMLATGMPPLIANATANLAILPGNIGAAYAYRRYLKKVPRSYLLLLFPVAIGSAAGALLLRHTSFSSFNSLIPWLILFAVLLFIFQPFLYKVLQNHLKHKKKSKKSNKTLILIGIAIIPLSVYGGYFGAGLGFVMLAFLGFTSLHNHIHRANALKCCMTVCVAAVSLACLLSSHLIHWQAGLVMASGNLIGGVGGASISQKVSSHSLRITVIIIGVCTATYLFFRSY
jgi:uncharacterized membrane protein YfcA